MEFSGGHDSITSSTKQDSDSVTPATNQDSDSLTPATYQDSDSITPVTNQDSDSITPAINQDSYDITPATNQDSDSITHAVNQDSDTDSVAPATNQDSDSITHAVNQDSDTDSVTPATNQDIDSITPVTNQDSDSITPAINQDSDSITPAINQDSDDITPATNQNSDKCSSTNQDSEYVSTKIPSSIQKTDSSKTGQSQDANSVSNTPVGQELTESEFCSQESYSSALTCLDSSTATLTGLDSSTAALSGLLVGRNPSSDLKSQLLVLLHQLEFVRMVRSLRKQTLDCDVPKFEEFKLPDTLKCKVEKLTCHPKIAAGRKRSKDAYMGKSNEAKSRKKKCKKTCASILSQSLDKEQSKSGSDDNSRSRRSSQRSLLHDTASSVDSGNEFISTSTPKGRSKSASKPSRSIKRHREVATKLVSEDIEERHAGRKCKVKKLKHCLADLEDDVELASEEFSNTLDIKKQSSVSVQNSSISSVSDQSPSTLDCSTNYTVKSTSLFSETCYPDTSVGTVTSENVSSLCGGQTNTHSSVDSEVFDPHLDVDMCSPVESSNHGTSDTSTDDSDDELINFGGFTPVRVDSKKRPESGDVVWIKWKKWPFLPAYVKSFNKKRGRMSIVVFGPKDKSAEHFQMTYSSKTVFPFYDAKKEDFVAAGQKLVGKERADFMASMDRVQDYLLLKAKRKLEDDMLFFSDDSHIFLGDVEEEEEVELPKLDLEEKIVEDEPESPAEDPVPAPKTSKQKRKKSECQLELSKKGQIMIQKRTEKSQKLCDFLVSDEVKLYLHQILTKKVSSAHHDTFLHGSPLQRRQIKDQGYGPIDDEEQIDILMSTYVKWLNDNGSIPEIKIVSYVSDVWVPEGIVYGLRKLKGYCKKKSWEMFHKGVSRTKEEIRLIHQEFMAKLERRK